MRERQSRHHRLERIGRAIRDVGRHELRIEHCAGRRWAR